MIIFMNFTLLLSFFIKLIFYKNEFSFVRSIFKRLKKYISILTNTFSDFSPFSFNKFIKFYRFFKKNRLNLKEDFKTTMYLFHIINNMKTKWYLINLVLNKNTSSRIKKSSFTIKNSKLKIFLNKNPLKKNDFFLKNFNSDYVVKYRPSSFVKFFEKNTINMFFLRKNKIFNKGRYSRNRQLYRTGVYWCIWLSVFLGYCLYFSFYRFTFNFGYQWWLIFGFLFLFVNQKMFKYNFYNIKIVLLEIKKNFNWISLMLHTFYKNIKINKK